MGCERRRSWVSCARACAPTRWKDTRAGETLKRLDRLLQTISGRGMATAAYAVIDPATGTLAYSSAGHPPPVIVRGGREASLLGISTAPPLGTLPFATYHETEVTLEAGDTILLYTDGLVERRREPLTDGLERLRALAAVPATADQLCQRVIQGLMPPGGGDDDIAVVALRIVPVEAAMSVRFAADPQVLGQMRRMLARWLQAHGAQPKEIDALTLACGEACANAIEHAYSPGMAFFELEAVHDDGLVTLTVRDTGHWRAPRGMNRGRGLKMIEAAIDELAVTTGETGTEVVMRHRLGPMTPLADVRFEALDRVVVARLEGEIDMSNASELGSAITASVPSDALAVVLDLGAVDYVDSAGIHVVFELRERLTRRGQEIRLVVGPDSPIATTLGYAGVPGMIGTADTVQDALADLRD